MSSSRSHSTDMKRPEGAARRVTVGLRCAFCLLLIGSTSCNRSSSPAIRMDTTDRSRIFIEVTGLSRADVTALSRANLSADEWSALLHVTVRASASGDEAPAMAGRYTVDASLRFWPAFPFDPGRDYEVRFDPARVTRAG